MLNPARRYARNKVDPGADTALVEVRLAIGVSGWKTQHGHYGDAAEDDHPNVRDTAESQLGER